MVLNRILTPLFAALAIATMAATPAQAHREHNAPQAAPVEAPAPTADAPARHDMSADHHAAAEPMAMDHHGEAAAPKTGIARLIDWLGRFHPMLVHFPLALLPMAFFAILVARRRPEWEHTTHILVVTAGLAIIPAALLGWFSGGLALAGDDNLLLVHRWLGTGIALGGAALALSIWRGRPHISHPVALVAVIILNIALVVQGWYGGALVHGADHLAW